jgi:hypothetical protein
MTPQAVAGGVGRHRPGVLSNTSPGQACLPGAVGERSYRSASHQPLGLTNVKLWRQLTLERFLSGRGPSQRRSTRATTGMTTKVINVSSTSGKASALSGSGSPTIRGTTKAWKASTSGYTATSETSHIFQRGVASSSGRWRRAA